MCLPVYSAGAKVFEPPTERCFVTIEAFCGYWECPVYALTVDLVTVQEGARKRA